MEKGTHKWEPGQSHQLLDGHVSVRNRHHIHRWVPTWLEFQKKKSGPSRAAPHASPHVFRDRNIRLRRRSVSLQITNLCSRSSQLIYRILMVDDIYILLYLNGLDLKRFIDDAVVVQSHKSRNEIYTITF